MINVNNDIKLDTNDKIILYLIKNLGSSVEGKKKLMKLIFLAEHYDFNNGKISSEKNVGNDYEIYYYGVYSDSVMDSIRKLVIESILLDGFPLKLKNEIEITIDKNLQNRLDDVIKLFGNKSGYTLELLTLEMLGIEPQNKKKYFGQSVVDILKK